MHKKRKIELQFSLGLKSHRENQFNQAKIHYEQVLKYDPNHFESLYLSALISAQTNQHLVAIELFRKALEVNPNSAESHSNLGTVLVELGRFDEAVICFNKAIFIQPNYAIAYANHGNALSKLKQSEAAIASYDKAIILNADFAEAYLNRGISRLDLMHLEEAISDFKKALFIRPDFFDAHLSLGNVLVRTGKHAEALNSFDSAISIKPDNVEVHLNRALTLVEMKRTVEALAIYDKAIAIDVYRDKPLFEKSLVLLLCGDFEKGWELYESRWNLIGKHYDFPLVTNHPLWLGKQSLVDKTILLHAEQGYGDTIQFCRYAKLVKALGATVLLAVPRSLLGLLSSLEGVDRLIEQGSLLPDFDYHCPLLSLPLAFKTGVDTIPSSKQYLFSESQKSKLWEQKLGIKRRTRVGLVWSGGFRPDQPDLWAVNKRRNLPFELLGMLNGLDVDFISLQKGEPAESEYAVAMRAGWIGPQIADYSAELKNFADTAALIENLDLVIAVDTSVAHLAAALGKPVWILNRFDNCWRWLQDRVDSPWYPTVKLYNQSRAGDWEEVMHRVRQDLDSFASISHSQDISVLLQQGLTLQQQGQLVEAAALYEQVLERQSDNSIALHLLGVVALESNNPNLALELTERSININPDQAPVHLHHGFALFHLKRLAEAIASFDRAIARMPNFAEAYYNRGIVLLELKQVDEALGDFERAVAIKPDFADAHCGMGMALQALQRVEHAMSSYENAIAIKPDYSEAHLNRGKILLILDRAQEALDSFERTIGSNSNHAEAYFCSANALTGLKRHEEALVYFDRAIAIDPDYVEAHFSKGIALAELKRCEEAVVSFNRTIALNPNHFIAYSNRGLALQTLGHSLEALTSFNRAIDIWPNYAKALFNKGNLLTELNLVQEAVASYNRAIFIDPEYADAYSNCGNALLLIGQANDAIDNFDQAIALKPDFAEAYVNKSFATLLLGDYEKGWELYEWRWNLIAKQLGLVLNIKQPLWLGEQSLEGKTILLHAEQGLGDTIQFCRYAKLVKALGATVLLSVPRPVLGLLSRLDGVDRLIEDGNPMPHFDFHCPLLSLPLAFKTRLDSIPCSTRYLYAEPEKSTHWAHTLGDKRRPRVGLVWSGGFRPDRPDLWAVNERRNLPFKLLGMLGGLDVNFISLQKGEPAESDLVSAMRTGWVGPQIADYSAELKNFADTAALIENLDLVIAVDTSVAHLAAALGKPVWILNRFDNCWRWLQDRVDSPWYPTVKLYNQSRAGDWEEVMHRVRQDLDSFASISHSQDISVLLQQGLTLQQQGQLVEAAALYEQVRATHPDNSVALHLLGLIALQLNNPMLALDLLGRSIKINPNQAAVHLHHGIALVQLKRAVEGIASYDRSIAVKPDFAEAYSNRGNALYELKRTEEAVASFDRAIAIKPDFAEAYFNRGNALHELKRTEEAVASYDRANANKPDFSEAYFNRGCALLELKHTEQALTSFEHAIDIQSDFAEAHFKRGKTLMLLDRTEEALASYEQAISKKPNYADAYCSCANVLKELKRYEEALAYFDRAIAIRPDYAEAFCDRCLPLLELRRNADALASSERALAINPEYAEAHFHKGNALKELNRFAEAAESFDRAIELKPDYASAYSNRGLALQDLQRNDEALASFERAIEICPDYSLAYANRGKALQEARRTEEAIASYDRAIEIRPDFAPAQANKSLALLLNGNFELGWALYEWRWNLMNKLNTMQPLWLGEQELSGKTILLHAEQGLGDTIQFCRYARLVKALGATVLLEVPKPLVKLLSGLEGVDRLIEQGGPLPGFDFHCPLMSLPLAFKTLLDTIPGSSQYLFAEPEKSKSWQQKLGAKDRPRVGLVWSGGFRLDQPELWAVNRRRNLPFSLLAMLSGLDVDFVSLQKGEPAESEFSTTMRAGWAGPAIADYSADLLDFADTAALIENLDLVISVDTSVAHLAAALGKPVWILNRFDNCWRWLQDRVDSPWYPTVKLYNQKQPGDWEEVMHRVRNDLAGFKPASQLQDESALLQQGQAFHQQGQLAEARAHYERVLARQPKNYDALNLLGVIAAQEGNLELAAQWMGKALETSPERAPLHFNRGAVLQQLRRTEEAMASFQRATVIKPDFAEAHFNLGLALRTLKRTDEALASFQRTIAIEPDFAEAHLHLGNVLQECKRTAEALTSYDRAIYLQPDLAKAHFNRGVVLQELKRTEDALTSYDRAVSLKPDYAIAHSNRGIALHRLGRSAEAIASFDRAIAIKPDYATAYSNRGIALHELKRTKEALASYERAIAINPEFADHFWNKSLALLSLGNLEQGWPLYEWRWKRANALNVTPHHHLAQPLWLGDQALAGKTILLHAEQGLGDTIQFCRYANLVKALGATVILEVPKALMGLLSGLEGVDHVLELGSPLPGFDFHCPLMSLPLAFKTRLDNIPNSAKYLHAQAHKTGQWKLRLGPAAQPRVGLVWSGGFRPEQPELWDINQRRNLPFSMLAVLNGLDVDFTSLQKGEPAESEFAATMRAGWAGPAITDYSSYLQDFADTAALIENLDLVISVDTSVAHLAAALGKPVWILNRFDSCWRWLQDRVDSPWYPTVKLYNQARAGDWEEVMRRVRQDLLAL